MRARAIRKARTAHSVPKKNSFGVWRESLTEAHADKINSAAQGIIYINPTL